eukprot:CAMPEP_0175098090 /NCGR_PEP_ID=MMETSP0086_2-20121207/5648_1 /TAXON_ID=136419 /ORGANISM="Unknown Unknown, Strain D1" /LENGTH=44 /DNA_ID= /DNA_START= /DNA_END= /DNA_ORIENTATION=
MGGALRWEKRLADGKVSMFGLGYLGCSEESLPTVLASPACANID